MLFINWQEDQHGAMGAALNWLRYESTVKNAHAEWMNLRIIPFGLMGSVRAVKLFKNAS
jgi:hypothetical protein